MRVISGEAKGHKLRTPRGRNTRPTTDRIKESLFNIISSDLYVCNFLDLFSGYGSIGIEALSRGAKECIFVDDFNECKEVIETNLKFTKLFDKAKIYKKNVFDAILILGKENKKFDIIFMDPPYNEGLAEPALKAIVDNSILEESGYIIVESSSRLPIPKVPNLKILRKKDYKTTIMTFFGLEDKNA